MTDNVVPLATEPYRDWSEGLLAVCEAIADRHRLPAVLRRLERTAEQLGVATEDLCALALTVPTQPPAEPFEAGQAKPPTPTLSKPGSVRPQPTEWGARLRAGIEAIEAPIRAREELAKDTFGPGDLRRILADTVWGVTAVSMVDTSGRLGVADPFGRLGARLGLWFQPSFDGRWMGVPLGRDALNIWELVRRLIARCPQTVEADAAALKLLRIATEDEPVPHSAEGLEVLLGIGEALEGHAAKALLDSLLLTLIEAIGWDLRQDVHTTDFWLSVSLYNQISKAAECLNGSTTSLPEWLRQGRRPVLLPDLSWFLPEMCFHLHEWPEGKAPEMLNVVVRLLCVGGFAVFPQGPFPLNYYRQGETERELPVRLIEHLPEAHDLLRLLSLRAGDWSDEGDEAGAAFWGDPTGPADEFLDLRTACGRALDRGDPALADMLLGCWLIQWLLGTHRSLPHVPDIARLIRRIPVEDRVSVHACLGLIAAELADDVEGSRRLSALLSYLPPIPAFTPPDPEAELLDHVGTEQWEWLSAGGRRVLLQNEHLFRDWRRLGVAEAEARGPEKLLPHWAAVFEELLRRALRRCDRGLAQTITDKTTLGQLLKGMDEAWRIARKDQWAASDDRRRHLIGEEWLRMLADLNAANTRGGKHLTGVGSPTAWHEVAALRSRVIFGGALRRALEAASKPAAP